MPDNRINFPSTLVDFVGTIGTTGQDHDNYPAPGSQIRYDHLRLYLIGLLSNQSSYSPPSQYREGTFWFDLNSLALKIRRGDVWVGISSAIDLNGTSLADWYSAVQSSILGPDMVFTGVVGTVGSTGRDEIPIPAGLLSSITSITRAFVTINGENSDSTKKTIIVNPLNVTIVGGTLVRLNTIALESADTFTVVLKQIPDDTFINTPVTVV